MELTKESLWMVLAIVAVLVLWVFIIGYAPGFNQKLVSMIGGG